MNKKDLTQRSIKEISDGYFFWNSDMKTRIELFDELKKSSRLNFTSKEKFIFNAMKVYNEGDIAYMKSIDNDIKMSFKDVLKFQSILDWDRNRLHMEAQELWLNEVKIVNDKDIVLDWFQWFDGEISWEFIEMFTTLKEDYIFYEWENMSNSKKIMWIHREWKWDRAKVFFIEIPNICFETE